MWLGRILEREMSIKEQLWTRAHVLASLSGAAARVRSGVFPHGKVSSDGATGLSGVGRRRTIPYSRLVRSRPVGQPPQGSH